LGGGGGDGGDGAGVERAWGRRQDGTAEVAKPARLEHFGNGVFNKVGVGADELEGEEGKLLSACPGPAAVDVNDDEVHRLAEILESNGNAGNEGDAAGVFAGTGARRGDDTTDKTRAGRESAIGGRRGRREEAGHDGEASVRVQEVVLHLLVHRFDAVISVVSANPEEASVASLAGTDEESGQEIVHKFITQSTARRVSLLFYCWEGFVGEFERRSLDGDEATEI